MQTILSGPRFPERAGSTAESQAPHLGSSGSDPADGMDCASGLCQSPSKFFISELCEVEGSDEGFVVGF